MADADSNQEAAFFVKQLKEFVGLGDIDDTAQWVAMTYNDVRRRRVSRRGAVALSVEILPPEEAEDRPAGQGRSEPNANPFLPPTTGRMSLSYNPLAIVSALLGPRLAFQLLCCLCCSLGRCCMRATKRGQPLSPLRRRHRATRPNFEGGGDSLLGGSRTREADPRDDPAARVN